MRRLTYLISLLALIVSRAPIAPCPLAAAADQASAEHVAHATSHQHAHAARVASRAHVDGPEHPDHDSSCSMATSCQWAAVPTRLAEWRAARSAVSASFTRAADVPITAEPSAATPPPKHLS